MRSPSLEWLTVGPFARSQCLLQCRHVLVHLGEVVVERVGAREFDCVPGVLTIGKVRPLIAIQAVAADVIGMPMRVDQERTGLFVRRVMSAIIRFMQTGHVSRVRRPAPRPRQR